MSTACGRPQGRRSGQAHVDACGHGEGGQTSQFSCGRHKWMTPCSEFHDPRLEDVSINVEIFFEI